MDKNQLWDKFQTLLRDPDDFPGPPGFPGSQEVSVPITNLFNYFSSDDLEGLYEYLLEERDS